MGEEATRAGRRRGAGCAARTCGGVRVDLFFFSFAGFPFFFARQLETHQMSLHPPPLLTPRPPPRGPPRARRRGRRQPRHSLLQLRALLRHLLQVLGEAFVLFFENLLNLFFSFLRRLFFLTFSSSLFKKTNQQELDADHDFLLSKEDLLRYGNHCLTYRVVDRIFAQAPRPFASGVDGRM